MPQPWPSGYFGLFSLALLVLYSPSNLVKQSLSRYEAASRILGATPQTEGAAGGRLLCVGSTIRGMLFLEANKLSKGTPQTSKSVTVAMLDVSGARSHVINNAEALSMPLSDAEQRDIYSVHPHTFAIPELAGQDQVAFDEVWLTPFLRIAPPIGDFFTTESVRERRIQRLIAAIASHLRVGSRVVAVDGALNTLHTAADLKDSGVFSDIKTELHEGSKVGASMITSYQLMVLTATYCGRPTTSDAQLQTQHSIREGVVNEEEEELLVPVDPMGSDASPLTRTRESRLWSPTHVSYVLMALQCITAAALYAGSAALFRSLSVPTSIVPGQRVNTVVISWATSYVMMAFFSRTVLSAEYFFYDAKAIVIAWAKSDLYAIVGALLYSALFYVPTLLLMLALSKFSSLSEDTKSIIGVVISIFVGFQLYKFRAWRAREAVFARRGFDETFKKYC